MSARNPQNKLIATEKRLYSIKAIADRGGIARLDEIQNVAGFSDIRVCLLSIAECALHSLLNIEDGLITITDKGVSFYNEHRYIIAGKLTQSEFKNV